MMECTTRVRNLTAVLVACLVTCAGCQQDPATTVTVEIKGINAEQDRDQVGETLKGMTDGSSHYMTSNFTGDTLTVKLSPVTDVQSFSRKINFGEVTSVEGRTVKVTYVD